MKQTAFISLGSNMGDRLNLLESAIVYLEDHYPIKLVNFSSIYETDPVGYENQDLFLNMVIQVQTSLTAIELLEACMKTESGLGRERNIRWGPRTIDLDILLYNDENIITERLVIPHPRMHERSFVIIPLMEVYLNTTLPAMEKPLHDIAEELPDKEGVRIWKRKNGEDVFALFVN